MRHNTVGFQCADEGIKWIPNTLKVVCLLQYPSSLLNTQETNSWRPKLAQLRMKMSDVTVQGLLSPQGDLGKSVGLCP